MSLTEWRYLLGVVAGGNQFLNLEMSDHMALCQSVAPRVVMDSSERTHIRLGPEWTVW